jgi:hypothetical protein
MEKGNKRNCGIRQKYKPIKNYLKLEPKGLIVHYFLELVGFIQVFFLLD